ncbi:hypothetical protein GCM10023081_36360 [Arthrobacter ginkgonis]|uniref:Uncharacterized protein n=1 Tax=Arthrobacter ginkgonis TaxID=1630594 RepID=A0ABP7CVF2_9MICC
MDRTKRLAAAGADPFVGISLHLAGRSTIEQGANSAALGPKDFTVHDSTLPYARRFNGESAAPVDLVTASFADAMGFVAERWGPRRAALLPRLPAGLRPLPQRLSAGSRGAGREPGRLDQRVAALQPAERGAVEDQRGVGVVVRGVAVHAQ